MFIGWIHGMTLCNTMGDCSGQPPPLFYYPLLFHLFSLVSDRFMIVLRKNVEKKSVPIRPCALGHFKVLQLWSNLQSFTGVLKVTIRGYTPMYDTSFFTIFWACCNGDGPAAGFCHPTPTPPASHLILTIFLPPCMIHHFSRFFEPVTMVKVLQLASTTPPHPPPT